MTQDSNGRRLTGFSAWLHRRRRQADDTGALARWAASQPDWPTSGGPVQYLQCLAAHRQEALKRPFVLAWRAYQEQHDGRD